MRKRVTGEQRETLRRNGKTFWLASLFLPRDVAADATILYEFCRKADDLADVASGKDALERLARLRSSLQKEESADPLAPDFLALQKRRSICPDAAGFLLDTLLLDASERVLIQSEDELLRYCYGAAGTVGLMMAPILGVSDSAALPHAVDLGIAMQLTNIARDVAEDSMAGRRYLPGAWTAGMTPERIAQAASLSGGKAEDCELIRDATRRVLALAEDYYASGSIGFSAIPLRARKGIEIAASVYREIGLKLLRQDCDPRQGRAVVSLGRKLAITGLVLAGKSPLRKQEKTGLGGVRHPALRGLPGTA